MIEKDKEMAEDILQEILENKTEDISTEDILRKAIEYKARILEFKEPDPENMLEVREQEELAKDAYLLKKYNKGIESALDLESINCAFDEEDVYAEKVIKFDFKGKEIVASFVKEVVYSSNIRSYYYKFVFFTNVDIKKRLHIQSGSYLFKKTPYDRCFIDYIKILDEYDMRYDKQYKEHFSDRLIQLKNKQSLNLEKYELLEEEKEFLMDMLVSYDFPYSLVLKDGVLCIHSELNSYRNL